MTEIAQARRARIAAEREAAIDAVVEALRALRNDVAMQFPLYGSGITSRSEKRAREALAAYDAAKGQE